MTDAERDIIERAYKIIDAFRHMIHGEIKDATQTMYMDADYQGLESACGFLGQILDQPFYEHLALSVPETRSALSLAAMNADAAAKNAADGSELEEATRSLETCAYACLNMTYGGDTNRTAQDAVEQIISISSYAVEIIMGLINAGRETLRPMMINPNGENIFDRIFEIKKTFESLQPRYNPEKQKQSDTAEAKPS